VADDHAAGIYPQEIAAGQIWTPSGPQSPPSDGDFAYRMSCDTEKSLFKDLVGAEVP
jgi:hypothetical protein